MKINSDEVEIDSKQRISINNKKSIRIRNEQIKYFSHKVLVLYKL